MSYPQFSTMNQLVHAYQYYKEKNMIMKSKQILKAIEHELNLMNEKLVAA